MTEQELNISKLSYVNKDFRSIYPDLLDLVKTLTNRWDPSASNESDPGVVLLKVGAFLADHLNYNIDKNILEAFLPSATQEESVRRIAEFGGYTPRYYRSAIGKVSVAYNPDLDKPDEFKGSFNIPPFTLVISNEDGSIAYTQLDAIPISEKGVPYSERRFIEGTVQRLTVDSPTITMNNIDDFRRIYFPNQYVAENGIFIYNINDTDYRSESDWVRTNYIYTQPLGTKCYKIDFDSSKSLPYIEFPSDIANLIGDGLAIFYIYTSGSYGNVKARELNTIVSLNSNNMSSNEAAITAASHVDNFVISNSASILNGCEPESINEIYDSYKKVVGTFDTLVSTQDYSNAIRTVENNSGERYVSNGLITDRRIDYNNAINVLSAKITGTYFKNVALNFGSLTFKGASNTIPTAANKGDVFTYTGPDSGDYENNATYLCTDVLNGVPTWQEVGAVNSTELEKYLNGMTPYDLIIYALQKYSEIDYNSIYYWTALENSFKQIDGDAAVANETIGVEDNLISALEEYKCINHTFTDLRDGQVYCFKNYVPLNVDIVPFNKVTRYERNEIINNIRKALSNNFNASKVEFGVELNYDIVKKVIEESDPRINYVRLADFNYHTKVMVKDSKDQVNAAEYDITDVFDDSTFLIDLAAKNVIAGRLCVFNFDDSFNFRFGQSGCDIYNNIDSIKTALTIPQIPTPDNKYQLNKNEYFEIYYPNYYSDKTFGAYVLYNVTLNDQTKIIPAGTEYTLESGENIKFWYKDSYGNISTPTVEEGKTIQASFDLVDFSADIKTTYEKDGSYYKQISSNESISTRILLKTKLAAPTYVYWILNNNSNTLFRDDNLDLERTLGQGEYFIYTNTSKTNLTIFGRGTHLKRASNSGAWELPLSAETKVSPAQFNEDGLASRIPFIDSIPFETCPLEITEMNIITLGEGDSFSLTTTATSLTSDEVIANDIEYITNDTTVKLPNQENFYTVRTRLDINASPSSPMILTTNQEVVITTVDDPSTEIHLIHPKYIQTNVPLALTGSSSRDNGELDLSSYKDLGIEINMFTYDSDENVSYAYDLSNISALGTIELPFSVVSLGDPNRKYIIQLFLSNENLVDGKVEVEIINVRDGTNVNIGHFGIVDNTNNNIYCLNNSGIYIYPNVTTDGDFKLRITVSNDMEGSILTVVDPKVINGVNDDLGCSLDDVVARINKLLGTSSDNDVQYHWTGIPNLDLALNTTNLLDPYSLFDHNNVANIITIPEIDLRNSTMEIVRSMRNY